MQKNYFLIFLLIVLTSACKKGEAPEEHYFGRIKVTLLNLPDAGKADIFLGTEKLGEINPQEYDNLELLLPSGKSGVLKIIDQNTSSIIADSNIVVIPNIKQEFRVGYSESLKIKGFISDTNVPEDSIRVQILYNLRKPFHNYSSVQLELYNSLGEPTGIIINDLKLDDPRAHILTFPKLGEGDNAAGYNFRLKDLQTGNFIIDARRTGTYSFLYGSPAYYGHYLFININDDRGDAVNNNVIAAKITIL